MQNQLATLAVGVRLYQHRYGEWPQHLDQLRAVGLDPDALVPLGGKPFGYRVEGNAAVLWGFDPLGYWNDGSVWEVPDNPPPLDDPNQYLNHLWIWRLSR